MLAADDLREAWFGLANARLRLGEAASSATALATALSRHALLRGIESLADQVAAASGAPGWCGLATGGRLVLGAPAAARVTLALDGSALPARTRTLPDAAKSARQLDVAIDGRAVLGSPLDLAAMRRIEGLVEAHDGGLAGWAWHPADPDREPVLHLTAASGQRLAIRTLSGVPDIVGAGALARPRGFQIPAARLAGWRGPFAVCGPDGADLLGSPLDTGPLRPMAANPPLRRIPGRRPVVVVIAVDAENAATEACLKALLTPPGRGLRVLVIDDAPTELPLAALLDRVAGWRHVTPIRRPAMHGFAAGINAAIRANPGRDIVLLSPDAVASPGWLGRLRDAAYEAADIGSVTPLANDGAFVAYPGPPGTNKVPEAAQVDRLDRLAQSANGTATVAIPYGSAFCLYLRHDCLVATGMLRKDAFAQGAGAEEVADWCLRAGQAGWRHVAATGVFVGHGGAPPYAAARRFLAPRNQAVLDRLHPGRDALRAAWAAQDPLATARRRLDEHRWRPDRPRRRAGAPTVLLITHDAGGGVERHVAARCAALNEAGGRPLVLRPGRTPGDGRAALLGGPARDTYPNLVYALPSELSALAGRLRAERLAHIELHHLLGHDPAVLALLAVLGVPYDVHVHDYAWFCPRIALVGPTRRYCGEPAPDACEACVAIAGRAITEDIPVQALIDRSARLLRAARAVIAPSADAAARLRRHFRAVRPKVAPHDDDAALPAVIPLPAASSPLRRIVTVGAIGVEKGFDVLLGCARDAAARSLPLEFVIVGHTIDDATLLATGRSFVTGEFTAGEAASLIRAQRGVLGLLPSVWPETWCFALSDLWRAGLRVAAFDLGAQAERIRASGGRGIVLPLGLSPEAINNTLLAAIELSGHQCVV